MTQDQIIGLSEGETVEFKRVVDAKGGYLEAVVAFLNTRGGTVYFGVDDTDEVATALPGVEDPLRDEHRLLDTIADRVEPKPRLEPPKRLTTQTGGVVLALVVPKGHAVPHAVRDRGKHAVYVRVASRNRPLSWTEIAAMSVRAPERDDGLTQLRAAMQAARQQFLAGRDHTTLRVACWAHPAVDDAVDIHAEAVRAVIADAEGVEVRDSGWNYLSRSGTRIAQNAIETGSPSDPIYRHLRVTRTGRVEFETERDALWNWTTRDPSVPVIYPFVLTEYPVSVLRLAASLHAHREPRPEAFLIEFVIRVARGLQLGPGRPDALRYRHGHLWRTLEADDLCVGMTGPLEVDGGEFLENPDRAAYRLVREAYEAVGFEPDAIPYWDPTAERFAFPK